VLTNSTVLLAFPHTILGAFTTGGMLIIAVCGLLLLRRRSSAVVTHSLRLALPALRGPPASPHSRVCAGTPGQRVAPDGENPGQP